MKNEFEYYFTPKKPAETTDFAIKHYVENKKLNLVISVHMDDYLMRMNDAKYVSDMLQSKVLTAMSEQLIPKMKTTFIDNPVTMDKTFKGETITMSYEQLYELLGHFGVDVRIMMK